MSEKELHEEYLKYQRLKTMKNPFEIGSEDWLKWRRDWLQSTSENVARASALDRELSKCDPVDPAVIAAAIEPMRKAMAEERKNLEQKIQQLVKDHQTGRHGNGVENGAAQMEIVSENNKT
ncbi:uncharacterized protein LOC129570992 [Sitodiplosis mosellana]|uniref:uncharacterized protein LOC129570992 n=1 Tax=Sitodiplosis mosellana TaxID=263140 RepID=UPI002444491A|nr:uncharacterized protein LOC129570992 [Sitodiplosis mosellana]